MYSTYAAEDRQSTIVPLLRMPAAGRLRTANDRMPTPLQQVFSNRNEDSQSVGSASTVFYLGANDRERISSDTSVENDVQRGFPPSHAHIIHVQQESNSNQNHLARPSTHWHATTGLHCLEQVLADTETDTPRSARINTNTMPAVSGNCEATPF